MAEERQRGLRARPEVVVAHEEVVLEARAQVLIPAIDDQRIGDVLHGRELLGRGLRAAAVVVEAQLGGALRLVAQAELRGEVGHRAADGRGGRASYQ